MTSAPDLTASDITVRFGGVLAVNDLSLHAPAGRITGLIGPNGAGKTTLFNACTGQVSTDRGSVRLGAEVLDKHGASQRALLGLGRTFQRMELWDSMTVAENIMLGTECHYAGGRPWAQMIGRRGQRTEMQERTAAALTRCGLGRLSGRTVGNLSTGQRRMVELARAMATPFRFLLLDEPASGLDASESEQFAEVLGDFVASTGIGVLLVEHDMPLVAAVCSTIFVMDFGRLIFSGTTAETMASELVRAAYLGDIDEAEAATAAAHA